MPEHALTERVGILEKTVEELRLLPDRVAAVESQILQLRGEMHDGFSAILLRLDGHDQRFVEVDQRFDRIDRRLDQVDQRFVEVDQRFDRLDASLEETRNQARVLHEEVLSRISLLQEGRRRKKS
jgi:hypothetical protein